MTDEHSTQPTPTSVYRYYDANGVLLYVGITSRRTSRQREHNADKVWWPFVTRQEVEHFPDRPAASARERELIRRYRTPFNLQHNPDHEETRAAYMALARHEVRIPKQGAGPLWDRPRGLVLMLTDHRLVGDRYTYWLKSHAHDAARFIPYMDGTRWSGLHLGNAGKHARAQVYVEGPDLFVVGTGSLEPVTNKGFLRVKFTSQKPPLVTPAALSLSWVPGSDRVTRRKRKRASSREVFADG